MVTKQAFKLYDSVFHPEIYYGNETFTIIGIRYNEVELQGDWSGGTHNVCQRSWFKTDGLVLHKRNNRIINVCERKIYS